MRRYDTAISIRIVEEIDVLWQCEGAETAVACFVDVGPARKHEKMPQLVGYSKNNLQVAPNLVFIFDDALRWNFPDDTAQGRDCIS